MYRKRCLLIPAMVILSCLPWQGAVAEQTAQDQEPGNWEEFRDRGRAAKQQLDEATLRRPGSIGFSAFYAPLSLPFPSSWGVDLYYIASPKWTWSVEYRSSSYDLGFGPVDFAEAREQDYGLHSRYYRNQSSFNMLFGIGLQKRSVHVARDVLEIYTDEYSDAVSETSTIYAIFGLGNHYRFGTWNLDVDWFTLSLPLQAETDNSATRYTSTEQGRKNARRAERFMKYFPSMVAFKFMVGKNW